MDATERSGQIFNPKLVAGLVAAGILAFVAFMLLSAYAEDFRSGRDGRPHALSISAVGFQGLVRLIDGVGGDAQLLRSDDWWDTEDLLVAALEPRMDGERLDELLEARSGQATLLILPKWTVGPDPQHPGWVVTIGPDAQSPAVSALKGTSVETDEKNRHAGWAMGTNLLEGLRVKAPKSSQTISGDAVEPLLVAPGGGALLARIGEGNLFVLADPDLMNNQGLKDKQTAHAALQILARLNSTEAESVAFDLTLNGFARKPSILKLPFEPPFLALTLALFAAVLLAGLHGAFRFGPEAPEQRAIAFGKLALVENSAGLIQLARREHRTGGAYADLIREASAQASGAPASLHGDELDTYLDRLSPPDGPKFSQLADQAQRASDRFQLLSAARALFMWKKDFVR
jgi:hypothetical protein